MTIEEFLNTLYINPNPDHAGQLERQLQAQKDLDAKMKKYKLGKYKDE